MDLVQIVHPSGLVSIVSRRSLPHHERAGWRLATEENPAEASQDGLDITEEQEAD